MFLPILFLATGSTLRYLILIFTTCDVNFHQISYTFRHSFWVSAYMWHHETRLLYLYSFIITDCFTRVNRPITNNIRYLCDNWLALILIKDFIMWGCFDHHLRHQFFSWLISPLVFGVQIIVRGYHFTDKIWNFPLSIRCLWSGLEW